MHDLPDNKAWIDALETFERADRRWHIALTAAFGHAAGDARYEPRGKGEPGSGLRAAYDERTAAREAWQKLAFG